MQEPGVAFAWQPAYPCRETRSIVEVPIRYTSFPRTTPTPQIVRDAVRVFEMHDENIGQASKTKGFGSDAVLSLLANDLVEIGFEVERSKAKEDKIYRPVFFGENGKPSLQYQVDAYHNEYRCGLEVEAGRGIQGGAVYRDLIQAMVMIEVDHLCLAMLNRYEFSKSYSNDYDKAVDIAEALYGHDRIVMPYGLTVIGYGPV